MKINLPFRGFVALFLIFTVSVSVISISLFKGQFSAVDLATAKKISEINRLVEQDYYFDVDSDAVTDGMISGYVDGLGDKYAAYYNLDTSAQQTDALNGDTHGIGIIAVESKEREIYVYKVYRDSPAAEAGIKSGDYIVAVGDRKVSKIGFKKAVESIQGSVGKKIKLTLRRGDKEYKATVKCADTDMQSVYSYVANATSFGVVQIIGFNKKTYPQFKAEVDSLIKENVTGLILDLRHNTGGTVETAAKMLDYLLPECNTVHVKYKDGKVKVRNKSDKDSLDLPCIILTDGNTASSSEIFVSVMRQQGKAVIMGSKTYGKSLIQRSYNLSDGSKVKFTIGEFVPENGESYNGIGITPDIQVDAGLSSSHDYYFLCEADDKVLQSAIEYMGQLS